MNDGDAAREGAPVNGGVGDRGAEGGGTLPDACALGAGCVAAPQWTQYAVFGSLELPQLVQIIVSVLVIGLPPPRDDPIG